MRQNNGINQIVESIRENGLTLERGSRPVSAGKGERFQQILSQTAARSNSGVGVV
jgi:hypothetical protein